MRIIHNEDDIDRRYAALEQKRKNRWMRKCEFKAYKAQRSRTPKRNSS